jgi:hypothetical protein
MLGQMFDSFDGVRFARMSSGTWCLVKDLGPVKGGKGMKHFQLIVAFSMKGLWNFIRDRDTSFVKTCSALIFALPIRSLRTKSNQSVNA